MVKTLLIVYSKKDFNCFFVDFFCGAIFISKLFYENKDRQIIPSAHERPAEQLTATFVILEEEEKKNSPHLLLLLFFLMFEILFHLTKLHPALFFPASLVKLFTNSCSWIHPIPVAINYVWHSTH